MNIQVGSVIVVKHPFKGIDVIAVVTNVDGNDILSHNMVRLDDLTPFNGRYGGFIFKLKDVKSVIKY